MNLAQLNVARLKYPFEDPRIADFADNLDRINGLAERSDGFVWRLQDDGGYAVEIRADADPMIIVNMSVWRDAESLERFVWNTVHKQIYRRRGEWFGAMGRRRASADGRRRNGTARAFARQGRQRFRLRLVASAPCEALAAGAVRLIGKNVEWLS
jgi:hypothetical protein